MKQIVLDTSFIISCVKQKIDFFEKLSHKEMKILIPIQAISELEGLGEKTELKILQKNNFETINVAGKDADEAIIKISKKEPDAIIATLDAGLKKKIKNKKMIIRDKKTLEIV